ncbi:MAG: gfo/Idh/MocA family oxidoreductase [Planctomycetia bacterium]|nr:gfo/Idh/MocA family oxidoreductase [Planctomycetia bacterium]
MPPFARRSGVTVSRRTFTRLGAAAAGCGGAGFFATHGAAAEPAGSAADPLNLAIVGLGGQGAANLRKLEGHPDVRIVALCDVDDTRAGKAYEQHPGATRFTDFRRMFDTLDKRIDAVVISTPDHTHFHPAWWALERGKHLYLEKPLAHEVEEVRRLTDAARAKGLATQLGSQRHALKGLREGVEIVKSGLLGTITEVHSWIASPRGLPEPLAAPQPVPAGLDWDLWLGPVAERPYTKGLAPYDWRFWWEFGTGETGNWGCHVLDIPFWALDLGHPVHVSGSGPPPDPQRTPKSLASRLDFPARVAGGVSWPAVSLHWYQGLPPILADKGIGAAMAKGKNTLFIGTKGMLICGFEAWKLLPDEAFAGFTGPEQTIPKSPGFHREWIDACRGGPPATCNFAYTGPLAESVLLANIAYRVQGGFDWDATGMKSNRDDVNAMLRRAYRRGWEV